MSTKQTDALKLALEAQERAWLWMENQADGQSKGGHATFDLMMLREERDALRDSITAIREALAEQPAQQQEPVTVLPDGSAFAVMSYPLPKDHWLYADRQYNDGEYEPVELGKPVLTHELRDAVVSAVRYAIRGATNCGKEVDFDPDALVQNAVYALCGPFTSPKPAQQQEPWPEEPAGHIAGGVQPSKETQARWTERWYGSLAEKGWWICCGREHIAHLGTEVSSDEVRKIIDAHNSYKPTAQQQEPVAWADMDVRGEDKGLSWTPGHFHKTPLYTTPPQRKPLTEKRIEELYSFWVVDCQDIVGFARAVERTVKGEV